jgi:P27 family predicted phage terminase small subunit
MGKRGPAPKPTRLRLLHGDQPCRTNYNEPAARPGTPEPPQELTKGGLAVWREVAQEVEHMGLLTLADRDLFAAFCELAARFREATALLGRSSIVMKTPDGKGIQPNPLVRMQREAAESMKRLAGEFGLTPRARAEIDTGTRSVGDNRESLLS